MSAPGRWALLDLVLECRSPESQTTTVRCGGADVATVHVPPGTHTVQLLVDRAHAGATAPLLSTATVRVTGWGFRTAPRVDVGPTAVVVDQLRPREGHDIVADPDVGTTDGPVVLLGFGWAPRELVHDRPVRWLGDAAGLVLAGRTPARLRLKGKAGPCLGVDARAQLWHEGQVIDEVAVDAPDGKRIDLTFDLGALPRDDSTTEVTLRVIRPRPVFTAHDNRVLNLLVGDISPKGRLRR